MIRQLSILIALYVLTSCAGGTDVGNGVKTTDIDETKLKVDEPIAAAGEKSTSGTMSPTSEIETISTTVSNEPLTLKSLLVKVFGESCTNYFKILQQKGGQWVSNEDIIAFEFSDGVSKIILNDNIILKIKELPTSKRCIEQELDDSAITNIKVTKDATSELVIYIPNKDFLNEVIKMETPDKKTYLFKYLDQ